MHKLSLSLTLSLLTLTLWAENTIHGHVTDAEGNPIAFATISALNADSTLLTGAITDEQGNYALEVPENAILQASYVGYQTIYGGPDFVLSETSTELHAVDVKAKRPLIERQMDKIVVNVSESPIAAGSSLSNVLKRAPGVRVDEDGNVTVNGKSVEIYIDGRPSYMSGEQLKGLLQGTDGSTIEKIEIITNPSAKYDAAGQGGIINIKLKKNKMQGLNGTLVASYGGMYWGEIKEWISQDYASLNLNYRTAKTYTNVQLSQVFADMKQKLEVGTYNPDTTIIDLNEFRGNFQYYDLRVSNDWMIDSVNTFGFIYHTPIMRLKYFSENCDYRMFVPQHSANLNFTHVFNANLDRELTVNVDYNRNHQTSDNTQQFLPTADDFRLDLNTNQIVDIASAKIDFQTRFWQTGMIEAGIKYAFSHTDNRMVTDSMINALPHSSTNNDCLYSENVAAAYITVGKQFGQKFNAKLGLRGEYTYSVGNWLTADSVNSYSYFNLFPTVFLGYNPTEQWGMSASYTRRIKRPTYFILNPFISYVDAHHYEVGNPTLMPEFNNDVQLNFNWSQFITVAGVFSHTQNMLNQRMTILPNGDGYQTWTNFGTCTTHGVNASLTELPLIPKKDAEGKRSIQNGGWLTLTINAGYYNFLNRSYDGTYVNQNHYWNANANLTAYLPKFWTLTLDGRYSAPLTVGYQYTQAYYGLDFGIRKVFPQQGIVLNLNAQDLLRSGVYRQESRGLAEGSGSWYKSNPRYQRVSLTLIYNFGKQEWHKQRKVGQLDETSRLGGGGTGIGNTGK